MELGVWLAESTFVIAYFKAHMNKLCHTRAPFHNNDLPDILVNYALRLRVTQSSDKKTFLLDADLPEFKTNEALKHAILSHRAEVYNYASYCDGIVCSRALLSRPINKPIKKKIGLQFEAMQNNDPYKSSVYGATKSHLPFSKDNLISVSTPLRAYHIEAERQRRKLENKLHREYFWECQISSYGLTGHPDHIEEPEDPESSSDDTDPFQKDFYILQQKINGKNKLVCKHVCIWLVRYVFDPSDIQVTTTTDEFISKQALPFYTYGFSQAKLWDIINHGHGLVGRFSLTFYRNYGETLDMFILAINIWIPDSLGILIGDGYSTN
ncbi:hypothetical protein J3Q64DRAFT_1694216 [Phycomyces blakesleeanus]|uniref:Uncharacterized protein n=1 Tax=Phycomyces blakesleeanus TaxID=4837 RepID=A0ABR3BG33_PHYBL